MYVLFKVQVFKIKSLYVAREAVLFHVVDSIKKYEKYANVCVVHSSCRYKINYRYTFSQFNFNF